MDRWDVVVVGGGPSGLIAAAAAAQHGARTLLLESHGFLGGCAAMPMPILGFATSGGRKVIAGIPEAFVSELRRAGGALEDATHPVLQSFTTTDAEVLKAVADDFVARAGADVLLHTTVTGVEAEGDTITHVVAMPKGGEARYPARIVVDASGDADVAFAAGARFHAAEAPVQSATVQFTMANVDLVRTAQYLRAHPAESVYPISGGEQPRLFMGFQSLVAAARGAGVLREYPRDYVIFHQMMRADVVGVNTTKINVDCTRPEDLTRAEIEGRAQAWEVVNCLIRYIPGFESSYLLAFSDVLGVRETRRVVGLATLTREHVMSGAVPADTIAMSCYPIDIHDPRKAGPHLEVLAKPYGIPYGCLVPQKVANLLVAGRCLSATQEAMASARVMANCMAMGQAAGTAAALCARARVRPGDLEVDALRRVLRQDGAIL